MTKPTDDFAERMKRLMSDLGVNLARLSAETGFTEEYLSQIETRKKEPTAEATILISRALTADSATVRSLPDSAVAKKKKAESFQKRNKAYCYKTLTPDSENKQIKAFLVTIEPETEHSGVEYQHEGEEFIYVLEGKIEIQIGQKLQVIRKGESLHFNSALIHKLRNPGNKKTEVIAVIYTP